MVKKKAQFAPPPFIAPFGVPGAGPPGRGIPQPGQAQLHGMPPGAMPPGMMPGMHPGMMMPWVWQVPGAWFGFGVQGGHQLPNMGPGLQPGHGLQLPMPGSMPGHQDSRSGQINLPSISAEVGNQRHEYVVIDTTRKENNRDVKVQVAINSQIYNAITNQLASFKKDIQNSPVFTYFNGQAPNPPRQITLARVGYSIDEIRAAQRGQINFYTVSRGLSKKLEQTKQLLLDRITTAEQQGDRDLFLALRDVSTLNSYVHKLIEPTAFGEFLKNGYYSLDNIGSLLRSVKLLLSSDKIDESVKKSIKDLINIMILISSDGNTISGYQSLLMAYKIAGENAFSSEVLSALVSGDSQQAAKMLLSLAYQNKTDEEINNALARIDVNKFVEEYGEKLQPGKKTKVEESELLNKHRSYQQTLKNLHNNNLQTTKSILASISSNRQIADSFDSNTVFHVTNAWFNQFSGIGKTLGEILADENKRKQALNVINRAISDDAMRYDLPSRMSQYIFGVYFKIGNEIRYASGLAGTRFIDSSSGLVYNPSTVLPLDRIRVIKDLLPDEKDRRLLAGAVVHYTIRHNPGISFIARSDTGNDNKRYTVLLPIYLTIRQNVTPEEYIKSVARAYLSYECNNGVSDVCDVLKGNNLDVALQHSVTLQRIVSSLINNNAAESLQGNDTLLKMLKEEFNRALQIKAINTDEIDETTVEAHVSHALQ